MNFGIPLNNMFFFRCMILWGSFTILLGLLCFVFLPDKPTSRWFRLSSIEKKIVEARVRDNVVVRNNEFKWEHIQEAVLEPRLYCYFLVSLFINLQNGCITVFMSQIISGMGFEVCNSYDARNITHVKYKCDSLYISI